MCYTYKEICGRSGRYKSYTHALPNKDRFMLDVTYIDIFVHRKTLFGRDIFRNTFTVQIISENHREFLFILVDLN